MKVLKKMNKTAKYILLIGAAIVIAVYLCAVVFYVGAGRFGNYYVFMGIFNDLLKCASQTTGVIVLGALLFQAVNPDIDDNR